MHFESIAEKHVLSLLDFERKNKDYFEKSIAPRDEDFYSLEGVGYHINELLYLQRQRKACGYVLISDHQDKSIIARANLKNIVGNTAEIGYRVAEKESGETFNSCLLNLYHNGSEGMAWHSDAEIDLKKNGAIASLSFGVERKFSFKHKQTKESVSMVLQHGSLLIMKDETQRFWLHRLPPTKTVTAPRVNLTFRTIDVKNNH